MRADREYRAAFFYHFYPHYRAGVIDALSATKHLEPTFYGGSSGVEGIREFSFAPEFRFREVLTCHIGKYVVQPFVPLVCSFSNYDCYIFLADPNHITTWIGAALCRLRGKRVVYWGHGFKGSQPSMRNGLRRLFFRLSNCFFTYGYRAKIAAVEMGFRADDIYVGFNSLRYSTQLPLRLELLGEAADESESQDLRIVCISRLTESCQYELLLNAISIVKDAGLVRPVVVMIGDGEQRAALEALAAALHVDVDFKGALYDEAVIAAHIYHADVVVSPGKIGLTAIHSLMYGTPIISHDDLQLQMPEVEAIIPGVTGDLFRRGDAADLAHKLATFKARYPARAVTRERCFRMIDRVYNPAKQADVMFNAIRGEPAELGADASSLFLGSDNAAS